MKKTTFLIFICFCLISCSKKSELEIIDLTKQSDRLSFDDFESYHKTYLELAKIRSVDDLKFWAQQRHHSTLLETQDSTMFQYSYVIRTIFNKDYEIEVGDSIIKLIKGDLYAYAKMDEKKITFSDNPEMFKKIGYIKVTTMNSETKSTQLFVGTVNAMHQYEFKQHAYRPCGGTITYADGDRKFVHEILDESTVTYPGPVYYSDLWLRLKLEYKVTRWRPASEQRTLGCYIQGSAEWFPGGFGGNYGPLSISESCWSGDAYIYLMGAVGASPFETPYWMVSMTGWISQHVNGDTNATWVNNTVPLW